MDNVMQEQSIDYINEVAAEVGCNCRVVRQWIKEVKEKAAEVAETIVEAVAVVKEKVEQVKDYWASTIEYSTEDVTVEDTDWLVALAFDCGVLTSEVINYIRGAGHIEFFLLLDLLGSGAEVDPTNPKYELDMSLWHKVNSTLSDDDYFQQYFISEEEEAGVVSFQDKELSNEEYFEQYEVPEEQPTPSIKYRYTAKYSESDTIHTASIVSITDTETGITYDFMDDRFNDLVDAYTNQEFQRGEDYLKDQIEQNPVEVIAKTITEQDLVKADEIKDLSVEGLLKEIYGDKLRVLTKKNTLHSSSYKTLLRYLERISSVESIEIIKKLECHLSKIQMAQLHAKYKVD